MFEIVELNASIDSEEYEERLPILRMRMLEMQYALREARTPVILIVSGVEGAGKGELVNRLNEWMDSRYIRNHAFWDESDEEKERPYFWRFWRCIPPRGEIAVFFGSWYTPLIIDSVFGRAGSSVTASRLKQTEEMERMLTDDGAIIIKLWFHLSKEAQKQALRKKSKNGKKLTREEKKFVRLYDVFRDVSAEVLRQTDSGFCPWHLIEATDRRHAEIKLMETFIEAAESHLRSMQDRPLKGSVGIPETISASTDGEQSIGEGRGEKTVLSKIDLSLKLDDNDYERDLEKYQLRINQRSFRAHKKKRSMIALFEGWDGAGKGSAIRRVTRAMDARLYRVIPIAAPTEEELAHQYLWRFWRHLPRAGYVTIYDRSWYGRVLVERVEGFAREEEWRRSYQEINDFEGLLSEHGILLAKFWIHIDKDEQMRRFQEREKTPWKHYKITNEDWRNREKWELYENAVNDMVAHTSTPHAPWTIISGNDKKFARIEILRNISRLLK